jgi:hypothetical protein
MEDLSYGSVILLKTSKGLGKSFEGDFADTYTKATGQHSSSSRCRIQTVYSLDYNITQNTLLLTPKQTKVFQL